MKNYYDELATSLDDARVVGWESRLAQLVRFEAVHVLLGPEESIIDLGAGLGDLGRYLLHRGRGAKYLGIEARAEFVARALTKEPPVVLRCLNAFTKPESNTDLDRADVVAVIGALVDGRPLTNPAKRFERLREMIQASLARARRLAVFVIARQDRIESHPTLVLDPALGGIQPSEIPWLLTPDIEYALISDMLPNDYVLVVAKPPHRVPALPTGAEIRASALAHAEARALPPDAFVRFHLAVGEPEIADRHLRAAEAAPSFSADAAWHLLKARLALALDS